jgi:hypothetical protein
MNPAFSVLIGGILPFGAVFIELFFILTSMWLHQFYYLFGFLCLVFVILIITCAEITIVLCYFQLCSEDYHWWCAPPCPLLLFPLHLPCFSIILSFLPQTVEMRRVKKSVAVACSRISSHASCCGCRWCMFGQEGALAGCGLECVL